VTRSPRHVFSLVWPPLLFGAAFAFISPGFYTDLAGVGLLVIALVIEGVVACAGRRIALGSSQVRIVLAELFLRGGDQAEIVLGVLVVVFSGDRVAGRLRVAGKLNVFFGDVGGISPDFDVGAVRLVNARHRIVILAVTVVVVAAAHAFVLTVSHDSPVR